MEEVTKTQSNENMFIVITIRNSQSEVKVSDTVLYSWHLYIISVSVVIQTKENQRLCCLIQEILFFNFGSLFLIQKQG